MSIEALITRIYADSEAEAQKILRRSNSEAARIRNENGQKLKEKFDVELKHHDRRIAELRNVHLAQAHREERRLLLDAREELITRCFSGLQDRLKDLAGDDLKNLLKDLLIEGIKVLGGEAVVKVVRDEDEKIVEALIKEVKKGVLELDDTGSQKKVKADLSLEAERLPAGKLGGVYLSSTDGKKVVDNTFSAIIERDRENYRIMFSKVLFNEGL